MEGERSIKGARWRREKRVVGEMEMNDEIQELDDRETRVNGSRSPNKADTGVGIENEETDREKGCG